MLNQPTSSPMMNRMLGFLPLLAGWPAPPPEPGSGVSTGASSCPRPAPSQQGLSAARDSFAAGGAASDRANTGRRPDAASHPAAAPTASTVSTWRRELLHMMSHSSDDDDVRRQRQGRSVP